MPTPIEWLSEFEVNTGNAQTGSQSEPRILGLSNGNFLVAWVEDANNAVGISNGTDIIGKIFDGEGTVVHDSFQINGRRVVDDEGDFDIAATNNGGFVMVSVDDDLDDLDRTSIVWERFDSDGEFLYGSSVANETDANVNLSNPSVIVNLTDNTSIVTFQRTASGFDNDEIRGVTVSPTGTVGTELNAGRDFGNEHDDGDVAVLANGSFVSVYTEEDNGTFRTEFKIFNAAGMTIASPTDVGNGAHLDPDVVTLSNGNFVVVWHQTDQNNGDIRAAIYTQNGVAVKTDFAITSNGDNDNEPAIVALPQGGFVVFWDNDTTGSMEAQLYDNAGNTDGNFVTVSNIAFGGTGLDVSATADGRVLFTWISQGDSDIYASIWDPRGAGIIGQNFNTGLPQFLDNAGTIFGSDQAETLVGTDADDTLNARGGFDQISGRSGNDTYRIGANNGQDIINDMGSIDDRADTIVFETGIRPISYTAGNRSDLTIGLNTGGQITISGALTNEANRIEFFEFEGQGTISFSQILGSARLKTKADLNNDGTSDILWLNSSNQQLGFFDMEGGSPTWQSLGVAGGGYQIEGVGNFNGDLVNDILWYNSGTQQVGIYEMGADGSFTWRDLGLAGPNYDIVGTGDLTGDGIDDILWLNSATQQLGFYEMTGNSSTFQSLGLAGANYFVAGIGDFDDDGRDDILWQNTVTNQIGIYEMGENNTFVWRDLGFAGANYSVVGIGDFNGDSFDDILWLNSATQQLGYYQMNPSGFTWQDQGFAGANYEVRGVGDFDGNGQDDIFWQNSATNQIGIYQYNGFSFTWNDLGFAGADFETGGLLPG